jgi:regulator of protease activity HflC (stomatin/prohibitin superfamily)
VFVVVDRGFAQGGSAGSVNVWREPVPLNGLPDHLEVGSMTREQEVRVTNGWRALVWTLMVFVIGVGLLVWFVFAAVEASNAGRAPNFWLLIGGVLMVGLGVFLCFGFFTLQPNEARVLILFGQYRGTVRSSGWHWTNPLNSKERISLRSRNFNSEKLKVNDKRGNPIEIAVVVVWRVQDTAQASFDVDQFREYVEVQSESAVRHLANCYPYDYGEEDEITLRSGVEDISQALQQELQDRVSKAGVTIEEARLTHLAYAPEIAGAMLRRQQAEAIIDARQKIVHGAVSMVQMALIELAEKQVIELDDERKASMVSNLLVVLCSEQDAQPVINAGTLYG